MENFKKIFLNKTINCEDCFAFIICKHCYLEHHPCAVCSTINNNQIIQRFKGKKVKLISTVVQMGFSVVIATNSLIRSGWNVDSAVQNALAMQSIEDERKKREEKKSLQPIKKPLSKPTYISLEPLFFESKEKNNNEPKEKNEIKQKMNGETDSDDEQDIINNWSYEMTNNPKFEILTEEDIYQLFLSEINEYVEIYDVDLDEASTRILSNETNNKSKKNQSYKSFITEGTCPVCYEDGMLVGERCGHKFCLTCWNEYLSMNGTLSYSSYKCMQSGCEQHLSLQFVLSHCNQNNIEKFKKMIIQNYLERNHQYQKCCGIDCKRIIHVIKTGKPHFKVSCYCGHEFCFGCGRERHEPASCKELSEWESLYQEDSESMRMIESISKPCFHCGLMTERTKGCNHMTCPRCHGEWCWMCRGDWKTHGTKTGGFYKCNLYETSEAKKLDDATEQTKEESERYQYYFERFMNHKVQIRLFNEEVENKRKLFSQTKNLNDVEILNSICSIIEDGIRVLQYSYVKVFFLPKEDLSPDLFVFRQNVLEITIDRLAENVYSMKSSSQLPMLLEEAMNSKTVMNNLVQL
ncbi:ankyrin repeat and ibr domain containing protein, putative [Entamoeba dispar SAW760]|uniref:RBR-type E3 ubiquitin transferase n=1 Tax=Entamoeba dispar (strain ATCC PRA-260 / SAW760) TaxID=370354 RepID=B0E7U5_ENTDS|nr:ankyrin repeat and ibr domain containing protein, putative [Entamoeba dispar SAW760]EDR29417.1 ankyrin repeat and ibr domain containing protein, putative [Entamoeba dispar SAW760]|eukprot:EDR29417.1 ankyrin repeat and ibr domain containing protein, putative [Entamoeba dispar SAW760]